VQKGLGLTSTGLFDPGLDLIWIVGSRSDDCTGLPAWGGRAKRRWRAVRWRSSPELAEIGAPGTVSRGEKSRRESTRWITRLGTLDGASGPEGRQTAARRGAAATASDCVHGTAEKRGEKGRRRCLPQCQAPAALARRRKVVERRRVGETKLDEGGGASELGFCECEGGGYELRWPRDREGGLAEGGLDVRAHAGVGAACRGRTWGRT
jgi:hypothetical protein